MNRKTNATIVEKVIERVQNTIGSTATIKLKTVGSIVRRPKEKLRNHKCIEYMASKNRVLPKYKSNDYSTWESSFKKMMLQSNEERFMTMIKDFYKYSLKELKTCQYDDGPIVVCFVKDERYRIKEFFRHYRALEVAGFIIIDNGSTDGTLEYLLNQDDTTVYYNTIQYNSILKTACINKAISYIGINRWYMIVDSDEFFVYPEMDKMSIYEYVDRIYTNEIRSVKTLMLEMYPNGSFFDENKDPSNFIEEYCYFDMDGRMHERLFGLDSGQLRWKVPLLYCDGMRFATGSHDFYPFGEYMDCRWGGIVLHYKFLSNERKKIDAIVKSGVYANNSSLYRQYQNTFLKDDNLNPYFERSRKWEGIESFKYFNFIEELSTHSYRKK